MANITCRCTTGQEWRTDVIHAFHAQCALHTRYIRVPFQPLRGEEVWKYYELRDEPGVVEKRMQFSIQLCYLYS